MRLEQIIARIRKEAGTGDIDEQLKRLSFPDIHSLLLYILGEQAAGMKPSDLLNQHRNNRFTQLVPEAKLLMSADAVMSASLPGQYELVELAPVAPFGTNSVLSGVSQNNVLSTSRSVEVLADPTTMLSLECAQRRSEYLASDPKSTERIHLAASSRSTRQQLFNIEGFTPHFRTFALVCAGRDVGNETFERETILEHIRFYLEVLRALNQSPQFVITDIEVAVSDIRITEAIIGAHGLERTSVTKEAQNLSYSLLKACELAPSGKFGFQAALPTKLGLIADGASGEYLTRITNELQSLESALPDVSFVKDLGRVAGLGYYQAGCFKISAKNAAGQRFPLVDGGLTDWTAKLTGSRKERFLSSGIGTELLCKQFCVQPLE